MNTELLPELDKVDWSSLGHPNIPNWVRNLASTDQGLRIEAYSQLEKLLVYAGTTPWENYGPISELLKTEMPIYIAPFLIELLENGSGHKPSVLQLIDDLVTYPSLVTNDDNELYRVRAERVFQEVKKGSTVFKGLLSDKGIWVQRYVTSILEQIASSV